MVAFELTGAIEPENPAFALTRLTASALVSELNSAVQADVEPPRVPSTRTSSTKLRVFLYLERCA